MGGLAAMLAPLSVRAQRARKVSRIVFFSVAAGPNQVADAFRRRLSELGYVEGSNLAVDYRWMGGHENQSDEVARQVVESQPDIIVATGSILVVAAIKATAQIPIVALGVNNLHSAPSWCTICAPRLSGRATCLDRRQRSVFRATEVFAIAPALGDRQIV